MLEKDRFLVWDNFTKPSVRFAGITKDPASSTYYVGKGAGKGSKRESFSLRGEENFGGKEASTAASANNLGYFDYKASIFDLQDKILSVTAS